MTDAEIVRAAAERVMGWREGKPDSGLPYSRLEGCWNPLTSDDHAFMLVDKLLGKVDIKRERNRHWICVIDGGDVVVSKDRRRCIVLACLKAVGVYV